MNVVNFKINKALIAIISLSLVLAACGGGSANGIHSASAPDTPPVSPPVVGIAVPTISLTAGSTSIAYNGNATISWTSTNSTSCSSAGVSGTGTTGSFNTGALTTTTTYTVTCIGAGGSASQNITITVAPPVVSGCSTTGATGAIALSNVPSRLTGVAPLSVFFDASGTSATSTTRAFHELEYRWNFGENTIALSALPGGANWTNGSTKGSRNLATGAVAAHVFETPGVYTVALSATDGTNTVSNSCVQIVVQDTDLVFAGANTICVAAASLPTPGQGGCPTGAVAVQQSSFPAAISSYALTGKRVLFKRGDSFTATTEARLINTGPGILGSYGSGALPLITMTANTDTLTFSTPAATSAFKDWRIMDLAFNGGGTSVSHGIGINSSSGGVTQITLLRVALSAFETSIGFGADALDWDNNQHSRSHTIDQLTVVDSTTTNGNNTSYAGYNAGNRVAFMGNYFENGGLANRYDQNSTLLGNGTHVLRFPYLNRAVISNNHVLHPGGTRHAIKMHAPFWYGGVPDQRVGNWSNYSAPLNGDGYTKYVIIADNYIASAQEPWQVAISPQDSANDERVRDVILERNLHKGSASTQVAQVIRAQEVTVRNNLFQGGGSNAQTGVMISVDGAEQPASNIRVYNNTQYSADAVPSSQFVMVDIRDSRNSNITIKNNLAYAPNAITPLLYANAGALNVVVSNNSTDSQIKNTSPLFAATLPTLITDWAPQAGSYAVNSGSAVPVWSDILGNNRTVSAVDIGAIERP